MKEMLWLQHGKVVILSYSDYQPKQHQNNISVL